MTGEDTGSAGGRTPDAIQRVRAENGFAYGVVDADIHVFGDGVPVYLLLNWRSEPDADSTWVRELPSRMLNARFAVVGFTGRDGDLAKLHEWKDTGPRLGALWLHAPGGQGKTRLAAQFAAEAKAQGWKVVTAVQGPGTVLPPPGSQDLRLGDAAGVLLIVDYADRWPLTHLTWLFSNALLHQTGLPTRILLIARSADAWPTVRAALTNLQAGTTTHFLEPLLDEDDRPTGGDSPQSGRAAMFTTARDSFAARYDIDDPYGIEPPGPLDDPDMGLTLAVHMAALVAVDAHAYGRRPPQGMAGLTLYLLDREQLHWATLYGDATHELDPTGRTYHTSPAVMNEVVFTAILTGSLSRPAGTAVLDHLQIEPADQVLTDHATCYPSNAPDTVLEPLYPDRLAEDFLALTLPGHPAEYPAQAWAPKTASTLARRAADGTPPSYITRTLVFLAAAAAPGRWPHVPTHVNNILTTDPGLAIDAGSPALTALAEVLDISVLEAIEPLFPEDRHIDLDIGIADVTSALVAHRLANTTDPVQQARLYTVLNRRLANAGRWEEALAAVEHAVDIHRRLSKGVLEAGWSSVSVSRTYSDPPGPDSGRLSPSSINTAASAHNLALSVVNRGMALSELGRVEEALDAATEAASLSELGVFLSQLGPQGTISAQIRPTTDLAAFAMSLNNSATTLSKSGRWDEALTRSRESVAVFRRLAAADHADGLPGLALALNNLGTVLSSLGRREEALAVAEEAVSSYRRLAEANPDTHLPGLARALSNLGVSLSSLGRREEALAVAEEAVSSYRRLAEANRDTFEAGLALALNNLGGNLSDLGRREEALAVAQEAVSSYRRLAEANPDTHLPGLARALNQLGIWLAQLGRREEALVPAEEAVSSYRRLAEASPGAFEGDFAKSLNNLGTTLWSLGRQGEALALDQETLAIRRQLAAANPDAHLPSFAMSLNNLGATLSSLGRREEALALTEEAVVIRRQLAAANPAVWLSDLAMSLNNLGAQLSQLGLWVDATGATEEAVMIRRQLAAANPAVWLSDLAMSLRNFSIMLSRVGRREEALVPAEEAVSIYRRLAAANPAAYGRDLAASRDNLGLLRRGLGRI